MKFFAYSSAFLPSALALRMENAWTQRDLVKAARDGDKSRFDEIRQSVPFEIDQTENMSIFMHACVGGNIEMVRELLPDFRGDLLRVTEDDGQIMRRSGDPFRENRSALYFAADGLHADVVQLLLDNLTQEQISHLVNLEESPIYAAAYTYVRLPATLKTYMTHDAHPERLYQSAEMKEKYQSILDLLLPYAPSADISGVGEFGAHHTLIEFFASVGNTDGVELLLTRGANPNFGSPLVAAAYNGHYDVVHLLCTFPYQQNALSLGQNQPYRLNLEQVHDQYSSKYGRPRTALQAAVENNHAEIISLLRAYGADATVEFNKHKRTNPYDLDTFPLVETMKGESGEESDTRTRAHECVVELIQPCLSRFALASRACRAAVRSGNANVLVPSALVEHILSYLPGYVHMNQQSPVRMVPPCPVITGEALLQKNSEGVSAVSACTSPDLLKLLLDTARATGFEQKIQNEITVMLQNARDPQLQQIVDLWNQQQQNVSQVEIEDVTEPDLLMNSASEEVDERPLKSIKSDDSVTRKPLATSDLTNVDELTRSMSSTF